MLEKNCNDCEIVNAAVTNIKSDKLQFYRPKSEKDKYRFTTFNSPQKLECETIFNNVYAGDLKHMEFDGIKIDIEGSEFGLIDDDLIPKCKKLVMEYHLLKDRDMTNFFNRVEKLRKRFKTVHHFPSLNKFPKGTQYPGLFDQFIWCSNE